MSTIAQRPERENRSKSLITYMYKMLSCCLKGQYDKLKMYVNPKATTK